MTQTPTLSPLLTYLEKVSELRNMTPRPPLAVWGSPEELILTMVKEPTHLDAVTLPDGIEVMEAGECYRNAFLTTLAHPNLLYAEGYAYPSELIPVNHAWCVDRDTREIIDPTWAGIPTGPSDYMGLTFSRRFMTLACETAANYPSVLEADWRRDYKTLQCGLVLDADGIVTEWGAPPPF